MSSKNSYKIARCFADALFFSLQGNKDYIKATAEFLLEMGNVDFNKLISIYQKDKIEFSKIFEGSFDKRLENSIKEFFLCLAEKKGIKYLPQIGEIFRIRYDEFFGIKRVHVYISDIKQKPLVESFLKQQTGEFLADFFEDKELLSGFKINFINENKILDMSMRELLSRI